MLWALLASYSHAGPLVWQVSKGDHHLYIGGTIHVLAKADWPIPTAYDRAYANSSVLVFETGLGQMSTPEAGRKLMQAVRFEPPLTLASVLDASTYAALKQYFEQRGVPMEGIKTLKPGMVSIMITMMELKRLNQVGEGVDMHYYSRAMQDKRLVEKLEDVETQIRFIAEMGQGQENELIRQTLAEVKELPSTMTEMKGVWRSGDGERLDRLMNAPLRDEAPDIYRSLMQERNEAWLPKIVAMLRSKEVEFILVGAAHLVGEDGVITQLARRGYRVRQLD